MAKAKVVFGVFEHRLKAERADSWSGPRGLHNDQNKPVYAIPSLGL